MRMTCLNLEKLVSEEGEKAEYPEKNLSEQGREPTTNSTYWSEASALTTAPALLSHLSLKSQHEFQEEMLPKQFFTTGSRVLAKTQHLL